MAYSELIKHFERIRDYIHEFYIYGFRSRNTIQQKSKRSYDNEKRRIESYFEDYLSFQYLQSKHYYLSIDNRHLSHNPLYTAFLSKSFTNKSITLHFMLLDILYEESIQLTFRQILKKLDDQLVFFHHPFEYDESTIRKKLNEYIQLGIIQLTQIHCQNYYHRASSFDLLPYSDALHFFSEYDILGIIGYYLLNRNECENVFRFKHHYIVHAIDSEIIYSLFQAIKQKKYITITNINPQTKHKSQFYVIPLKIYMSSQTGRAHLLAYSHRYHTIKSFRLDHIHQVVLKERCSSFDTYRTLLNEAQSHIWSIQYLSKPLEHIEFVIYIGPYEDYILHRLIREKRTGTILQIDDCHYQFQIDVYDSNELLPWIRSFICRLTKLRFSNRSVENSLKEDIERMYIMYEIGDET